MHEDISSDEEKVNNNGILHIIYEYELSNILLTLSIS